MNTYSIDRDRNGNLPQTHRDGICPATAGEVNAYVREFGTARQRELLGV